MKKPLFKLFYSLSVNKTIGGSSAPSAAPSTGAEAQDIAKERKGVLNYIDNRSAMILAKAGKVHGIMTVKHFDSKQDKLGITKGYEAAMKRLKVVKAESVKRIYTFKTAAEIKAYQTKVENELNKIEKEIDILQNKLELQKELKKFAQAMIEVHLEQWEKDQPVGLKKAATRKEILIIATGYIGRWYKVNSAAILKLKSFEATKINLANFKAFPPRGELFNDLAILDKEINEEVYEKWITGMEHAGVLRTVFSKLGWETKFIKDIKDSKLKQLVKNFNSRRPGLRETHNDVVTALLEYIEKKAVPGNLPDFPGRTDAIAASGIQAGIETGAATKKPKSPEKPVTKEAREKYVKQYRKIHEAALNNMTGIKYQRVKEKGSYANDIVYEIWNPKLPPTKNGTRSYYRPEKQQYGLSANATYLDGTSPEDCSKKNIALLKKHPKLKDVIKEKLAPKIASIKVEKGNLHIEGANLPEDPITVNVPDTIRSAYLTKGIKYESSDVGKIIYKPEHINALIVERIFEKVDPKLKPQLRAYLKQRKNAKVLQELLKTGPKPTLRVIGRASMDGRFGGNKEVARRRANDAKRKIAKQVGGAVKLVAVPEVVGHDGESINNLTTAYIRMTKAWNKLKGSAKKKIKSPQMRKIVSNYVNGKVDGLTKDQKDFLKKGLDDQRGVQVEVVAPRKPRKFIINFKNAPTSVPTS